MTANPSVHRRSDTAPPSRVVGRIALNSFSGTLRKNPLRRLPHASAPDRRVRSVVDIAVARRFRAAGLRLMIVFGKQAPEIARFASACRDPLAAVAFPVPVEPGGQIATVECP